MDITLERLTDLVALHLGEYPDWRDRRSGMGLAVSLDQQVALLAGEVALEETRQAALADFMSPVDIRYEIYRDADFGDTTAIEYDLPADFLRLHSLQMSDWPEVLSEDNPGDQMRRNLGNAAPEWLSTRPRRPRLEIYNLGSTKQLRFGPTDRRIPRTACYIARPTYSSTTATLISVDPGITLRIARKIAEMLKN